MPEKSGIKQKVFVGVSPIGKRKLPTGQADGSERKSRVFVGLSGGVDSSVSAALLKEQGYDVTGVFIKGWHPEFLTCTWRDDRQDAMRVCAHLRIPFVELDLSKAYKEQVVDYLIREYEAGRTPNPDVMCNQHIKFGAFFDWAIENGADFVATGHYARTLPVDGQGAENTKHEARNPKLGLYAGVDGNKDQSYFLWAIPQEKLSRIIFPIGEYTKPEVRKLAEYYGLPTAAKKDSQGVCFLGQLDMKEFLARYISSPAGDVINEAGDVVGRHDGAAYYTLGQRHGFTTEKTTPQESPYYIVAKDMAANTITVARTPVPERQADTAVCEVQLKNCNWFESLATGELAGRFRYRQPLFACTLEKDGDDGAIVRIKNPTSVPPAGQSLVLYLPAQAGSGETCIGGGVVLSVKG